MRFAWLLYSLSSGFCANCNFFIFVAVLFGYWENVPNLRRIRECSVRFALLGGSDCITVQFVSITIFFKEKLYIFVAVLFGY